MSDLTLTGDIINNTGKYLPAPYIEKMELQDDLSLTINGSIFISNYDDAYFYDDGEIKQDKDSIASILNDSLYYYVAVFMSSVDGRISQTGSNGDSLYQSVISKEINPFMVYYSSGSADAPTPIFLTQIEISSDSNIAYDESGNEIRKYDFSQSINLDKQMYRKLDGWSNVASLQIIAFSSVYEYSEDTFPEQMDNLQLLDFQTSEVSYESIFNDSGLSSGAKAEYLDAEGNLYSETPLISLNGSAYKTETITHQQVVDKFQNLLDEYQSFYEQGERYSKLKDIMDNVSSVLATYGESADLLIQLNQIARVYPDKSPAKPIGKFYKNYRKRLVLSNNSVQQNAKLIKQVLYDSKISDLREIGDTSEAEPNNIHDTDLTDTYIYTDSQLSMYECADTSYDVPSHVIFGRIYFDYEKALQRTSNISKILNVNKLKNYGIEIDFNTFFVESCWVYRYETNDSDSSLKAIYGSSFATGSAYPISEKIYARDQLNQDDSTQQAISYYLKQFTSDTNYSGTPYYYSDEELQGTVEIVNSDGTTTISDYPGTYGYLFGYASSVIYRQYLDPSLNGVDDLAIKNYRLMSFEILDYAKNINDTPILSFQVVIKDRTATIANTILQKLQDTSEELQQYYDYASDNGAFNENLGKFNRFFRESASAQYQDKPSSAPWYTAPFMYCMILDLYYNLFDNDIEKVTEKALQISQTINPINGNLEAIESFQDKFSTVVNNFEFVVALFNAAITEDKTILRNGFQLTTTFVPPESESESESELTSTEKTAERTTE